MRLEGWEGAGGLNSSDFECLGEQRGTLSQVPSQSLLCRFWRKKKFQGPPPGLAGADTDQTALSPINAGAPVVVLDT